MYTSTNADPAEIGRNYQTELGVVADARLTLAALALGATAVLIGRGLRSVRISRTWTPPRWLS